MKQPESETTVEKLAADLYEADETWRREYDQMMRERQAIQDRLPESAVEKICSELSSALDCFVPIMVGKEVVAAIVWELEKAGHLSLT